MQDPLIEYSIIVPAFNEEAFLPTTLIALTKVMQNVSRRGELIVVDNNSDDATAAIARSHGARVVFESINQISRARNAGGKAANGPWLIFIDADTTVSAGLLQTALDALATDEVCGGGAIISFDRYQIPIYRWPTIMWNGLAKRFKLAAGSFIFCRRDAFLAIGGFSEEVFAGEELFFVRLLKKWGESNRRPFRFLRMKGVVSSARKLDWFSLPQFLTMVFLIGVFPYAIRYRSLCGFWYKRPQP
ncbi:MAG: glycosyltransferase [Candidatus Ozemobacteraceae bacterium]